MPDLRLDKPRVKIPTLAELKELRRSGSKAGYKGIYIYLRYLGILQVLSRYSFKKVLNVGCGYGIFDRLLPANIEYLGVDTAEEEIRFASEWASNERKTFEYKCVDLSKAGLPSGDRDLVILSEVIEHIPEEGIGDLINEIHRILAENGLLLITVPNRNTARNIFRRLFFKKPVIMDTSHLREYSLGEIKKLLSATEFKLLDFKASVLYLPFEKIFAWILPPGGIIRRTILKLFPGIASHFIFCLKKN